MGAQSEYAQSMSCFRSLLPAKATGQEAHREPTEQCLPPAGRQMQSPSLVLLASMNTTGCLPPCRDATLKFFRARWENRVRPGPCLSLLCWSQVLFWWDPALDSGLPSAWLPSQSCLVFSASEFPCVPPLPLRWAPGIWPHLLNCLERPHGVVGGSFASCYFPGMEFTRQHICPQECPLNTSRNK